MSVKEPRSKRGVDDCDAAGGGARCAQRGVCGLVCVGVNVDVGRAAEKRNRFPNHIYKPIIFHQRHLVKSEEMLRLFTFALIVGVAAAEVRNGEPKHTAMRRAYTSPADL